MGALPTQPSMFTKAKKMIQGFENETATLTDYERDVLKPIICKGLAAHVGADRAITNAAICAAMRGAGYQLTEPRLRKIVNYIRCNDEVACLIATSAGYYVAQSEVELREYEESLLSRERAIAAVRQAMQRQRMRKFAPQQGNLF